MYARCMATTSAWKSAQSKGFRAIDLLREYDRFGRGHTRRHEPGYWRDSQTAIACTTVYPESSENRPQQQNQDKPVRGGITRRKRPRVERQDTDGAPTTARATRPHPLVARAIAAAPRACCTLSQGRPNNNNNNNSRGANKKRWRFAYYCCRPLRRGEVTYGVGLFVPYPRFQRNRPRNCQSVTLEMQTTAF